MLVTLHQVVTLHQSTSSRDLRLGHVKSEAQQQLDCETDMINKKEETDGYEQICLCSMRNIIFLHIMSV
ncbi:hypothetical protein F2P81_025390 [Scophthalmus maximus]|uniref:Uncharacterized protein n=1 Tax=Scophthalmus maximus TaxID=52904 RepID=A0A6A4RV05_SCOMX|nr:hypothetical protein F2P81_025390 [Scophthalmus maximus]